MLHRTFALVGVVAVLGTACSSKPNATPEPPSSSQEVTAGMPSFTNPLEITNPYYPVSSTALAVRLGTDGGKPARVEVALLPQTRMITWAGGTTETAVVHFVGYVDGELVETAYDYFAQADNGAVYYFGEDVTNYENGEIKNHDGTWLAGKDGAPPGLIMPPTPKVGDVYNPENLPGVAYETDEVVSVTARAQTPAGTITNGMEIEETLMDGSVEHKIFAPGLGIAEERTEDELLRLALHLRVGAAPRTVPDPLRAIDEASVIIIEAIPGRNWSAVRAGLGDVRAAWDSYAGHSRQDGVPEAFDGALRDALVSLEQKVNGRSVSDMMQAANDLRAAALDVAWVFRPGAKADLGRLDVLGRQVALDASVTGFGAASDDVAKSNAVWERLKPFVLARPGGDAAATKYEASLAAQRRAVDRKSAVALSTEAKTALELVAALAKLF
jgi:hypothetical protein